MAKTKVSQYDATAASNTDVANINIAEGCSPSNVNNAIRAVMGHLKDFQAGNVTGNALAVAGGGTGAETVSAARTNLSAAASGANSDITSLTGLTTPLSAAQGGTGIASYTTGDAIYASGSTTLTKGTLPVASGGTGATSLTANNVLLGNGTSAPQTVAPGTSGNVLTSNGTTWTSAALSFDKSFGTNGYQKFPGGFTVQWGYVTSIPTDGGKDVTFSTAFGTAVFAVIGGHANYGSDTDPNDSINVRNVTTTGFRISNASSVDSNAYYIAIGY